MSQETALREALMAAVADSRVRGYSTVVVSREDLEWLLAALPKPDTTLDVERLRQVLYRLDSIMPTDAYMADLAREYAAAHGGR